MDSLDLVARQHSSLLLLGLSRYDAAIETELAFHISAPAEQVARAIDRARMKSVERNFRPIELVADQSG